MIHIPDEISLEVTDEHQRVFASKIAIQMVVLNLLTNAIKYNDKQRGMIKISIYNSGEGLVSCSIDDNGKGIPTALQEKIFKPFTTLGETDRFGKKGHGLGLSSVAQLLEKNNGKIELKSIPGEGSTFTFTLHQS